ncbi:ABC transporter permease subunit [Rhodospirillaceae bacterium SYSU D60014]|jgi:NitT/TauT family transport system permease protein|uniref:ABC transporter permease n=1 Tax=Virgifigura deserti TaxID=2268457 RepID=UPI000E673554
MTVLGYRIPMMFSLLAWFVVWEIVGQLDLTILIPPFSGVIAAGITMLPSQKFHDAITITMTAFLAGMGLSLLVGIPLGILMGRVKAIGQLMGMWVNIFESSPLTAVIPVLMALLGFGQATIITTVFLFSVWVIALDVQVGAKHANASLLEMGRSFGASRFALYTKILFFAALPEILAGVRLGLIRGVKGVVIGQLLVAIVGVGELFELYSRNFLMEEFWALVIMVFAFAFAISETVAYVERRIEYYASTR